MNHKMNGQAGFTLIELIVVIVILGILAVTAAPKFMNLTSDANASVVKGLSGSVKSAYQMVYAKSRLNTTSTVVCAAEDCQGKTDKLSGNASNWKDIDGAIAVTSKGYPRSSITDISFVGAPNLKNTIAGAVDLGIAWDDYKYFNTSNGAAPDSSDWLIYENAGGIAFVPKSAPTDAKTRSHYTSATTDTADAGKSTCGVYYKAVSGNDNNASAITPVVKVFVKGC